MSTHDTETQPAGASRGIAAKAAVLTGAMMVQLILGTVYGYSIFWQPLERRIWPPTSATNEVSTAASPPTSSAASPAVVVDPAAEAQEHERRLGVLKYAFAACLLSFAGSMVVAGRLQDARGPRFTASLGGAMLGIAFLLAGAMDTLMVFYACHAILMGGVVVLLLTLLANVSPRPDRPRGHLFESVPFGVMTAVVVMGILLAQSYVSNSSGNKVVLLLGTIGVLAGTGIGFAYVAPIAALVKWFPRHKGLVSGLAVAGFGLGAYIISGRSRFGGAGFIEAHGIESFFRVHGIIAVATVCGGALLLRNPPTTAPRSTAAGGHTQRDATWRELLRSRQFFGVWTMFFSGAMAGLMVIGILKPFAGSQLVRAAEQAGGILTESMRSELLLRGTTAVGVLSLFNAAGRVLWGWLSDRIGRTLTMTLMFSFQAVTLLSLATLDTELKLAIGAACVGFNFGGNFALFPSLTADLFGSKNFGANYGWVFTSYGIAGVLGVWVGNTAQQISGSYFAAFVVAATLCLASAILSVWITRPGPVVREPLPSGAALLTFKST